VSIEKIISGLRKSPLSEEVGRRAIAEINKNYLRLEKAFKTLKFVRPSLYEERYHEIAQEAIDCITSLILEENVSERDGINVYVHIFCEISGEKLEDYLARS